MKKKFFKKLFASTLIAGATIGTSGCVDIQREDKIDKLANLFVKEENINMSYNKSYFDYDFYTLSRENADGETVTKYFLDFQFGIIRNIIGYQSKEPELLIVNEIKYSVTEEDYNNFKNNFSFNSSASMIEYLVKTYDPVKVKNYKEEADQEK